MLHFIVKSECLCSHSCHGDDLLPDRSDLGLTGSGGICSITRANAFTLCLCQTNEEAIAERIDEFIVKLKELKHVASPFTLASIEGVWVP